ncbi:hypothetical protein H2Y57_00680 [Pectobacterium aroidearum]|uniref:DUF2806 domain-containing protein n=1 Tax=Pectobacterium aroidearum TaxID=1201031 RepID=A0AAW3SPA5_9GAMM|nr:hypothetical protein [Pectobacterium aroidearum]MBA5202218.1 hypothetical protein [Pectobacterium aroidearum]
MKPEMSTAVMIERLRALIPDSQDGSLLNQVANRIELLLEAESGMSREMACIRHALDIPPDQSVQSGVVDAFVRLNGETLGLRSRLEAYDRAAKEPVVVNDDMALAFFRALTDETASSDDVDECKIGLRAAFANIAPPLPVVPDEKRSERFDWSFGDWARHLGGRHQGDDPANYYEFGSFMAVAEMLRQFGMVQQKAGWNACRAAMLQSGNPVWIGIDWAKGCGPTPALEGWALVPVTADSEMMAAAIACGVTRGTDGALYVKYDDIYAAMIAAAPQLRKDGDA